MSHTWHTVVRTWYTHTYVTQIHKFIHIKNTNTSHTLTHTHKRTGHIHTSHILTHMSHTHTPSLSFFLDINFPHPIPFPLSLWHNSKINYFPIPPPPFSLSTHTPPPPLFPSLMTWPPQHIEPHTHTRTHIFHFWCVSVNLWGRTFER